MSGLGFCCAFSLVITSRAPGTGATAPLPDIITISAVCPAPAPCFKSFKFSGTATGPLRMPYFPAGTLGTMSIAQTNTLHLVGLAKRTGGITADNVTISPTK